MNQLQNNPYQYNFNLELYPATMQGAEAPAAIIAALHKIMDHENAELVVLIRGGGSQLDLDCFNNYELCSHLAQFPLPVLTGIGHERDETIADLVAHTSLKTPTAVAEFLIQGFIAFEAKIEDQALRIARSVNTAINEASIKLESIEGKIHLQAGNHVATQKLRLDSLKQGLKIKSNTQLRQQLHNLNAIEKRHLDLNPANILKRGFTFTTINRNSIFAKKVKKDDVMVTYSSEQIIESKVTKSRKNDKI